VTVANAAVYFVAAAMHWGARIPVGPVVLAFPAAIKPATVVEGVIGAGLAGAAVAQVLTAAAEISWAAYGLALVGTLFGLTIALVRGLSGPDIWAHFVMLAGLAAGFALLVVGP
jgi:hypothetical protein